MSCCGPIIDGVRADAPESAGWADFGVVYMHRVSPAPQSVSSDAAWQGVFAHFSETLMHSQRGPATDTPTPPFGGSPANANELTLERRFVSHALRPGTSFAGATLWAIMMFGNATPTASILAAAGVRIVDPAGATAATLLAVGTYAPVQSGGGTTIAGANQYQTTLMRQPLASYVVPDYGYRLAIETGALASVSITAFSSSIGSRANAAPSSFEFSNHVMGFGNVGNPGNRCGFFSFDNVTFPSTV